MELRLPLEMSPGREAACRAVFGTWGFFRTMHGKTAPSLACQALLSMGFSRQEYWSGCHVFLQGIFLTRGSNHVSCIGRQVLYHWRHLGSPLLPPYANSIPITKSCTSNDTTPSPYELKFFLTSKDLVTFEMGFALLLIPVKRSNVYIFKTPLHM